MPPMELVMDYRSDAETTKAFFAQVQNKLHFAIHGHTAAELIMKRADNRSPAQASSLAGKGERRSPGPTERNGTPLESSDTIILPWADVCRYWHHSRLLGKWLPNIDKQMNWPKIFRRGIVLPLLIKLLCYRRFGDFYGFPVFDTRRTLP